ncbi:hypothetical protein [Marinivivus vitaminiproducens]|uniref:hypothetical protein n=1 Tax=Marinivivus vitaminiproducens TaxID=3035935 RepID=UPI00279D6D2C|nr:hypothetical protein P4R82_24995 [Geminicoccaceae bacterium SCSIO 64248]
MNTAEITYRRRFNPYRTQFECTTETIVDDERGLRRVINPSLWPAKLAHEGPVTPEDLADRYRARGYRVTLTMAA